MGDAAMINLAKLTQKINSLFGDENLGQKKPELDSDHHFLHELLPYRFFDEKNGIFINDSSLGFILEASPLVGASEETIDTLSGMITEGIPEGCTIQFINWASPKVGHIFNTWKQAREKQGGVYLKLAKKRVEFFQNSNHQSLFANNPFTTKDFRLFLSVSISVKKNDGSDFFQKILKTISSNNDEPDYISAISSIKSLKEKLATSFRAVGMNSFEMNPEDLIRFLDEIVNFSVSQRKSDLVYDPLQPINKQIVDPENILKKDQDELTLFADDESKKTNVRCFSVRSFPKTWAQWQCRDLIGDFFQDLRRMEYPFLTSFSVTLPYNELALQTRAKQKSFHATRMAGTPIARFIPEISSTASEWQFVTEKTNSGQRILKGIYQVLIFAPPKKINESEQLLKSIYKAKGWELSRDKFINIQSFLGILPFKKSEGVFYDMEKMNRTKTMVSWTAANLAPFQGEWKGMASPCMLLFGRRGQPLYWDPFKNEEGNYNVAVIGKSGSGKSVFMQDLVASLRGNGGKVYVIDDGRSFMNSCRLQGGEFIEFSDKGESQICINPFSIVNEETMEKSPEYKTEVIKLITAMICQMCEGDPTKETAGKEKISTIQSRYIEEAVANIWAEHGRNARITTVRNYFAKHAEQRARDLAILIKPFTKEGVYGRFFEGESSIRLENPLMVFELAELKNKKELQAIVLMFLMFLVSENMYFGDRKTPITLLIDEAWDLLHGEGSKTFIEGMARRARKYCGNIVTGTQSVNDYYKNPATLAAFENTDWIILLSQKPESIEQLAKTGRIVMDDALKEALKSLRMIKGQYSEAVIYGPRGWAIVRTIFDPYSISLYSSSPDDWSKINDLREKGYSLEDALEVLADSKSKSAKKRIFEVSDYVKIMSLKDEGKEFEDALEIVAANKFRNNPTYQQQMKLQ
jgi:conjugal transfer ATP-binding protein TraC